VRRRDRLAISTKENEARRRGSTRRSILADSFASSFAALPTGRRSRERRTTAATIPGGREREDAEERACRYLRIRERWHYPETGMTPLASRCDETTTLLLLLLLELAPGARCYTRTAAITSTNNSTNTTSTSTGSSLPR